MAGSDADPGSAGAAGAFSDIVGGLTGIFGGSTTINTSGSGTTRESLEIDEEAIDKLVEEMLSGTQGLAAIFGGEQTAGVFDSSVSAQAGGNLLAKVAGEIAKLTAVKTTESETSQKQKQKQGGLLGAVGDLF